MTAIRRKYKRKILKLLPSRAEGSRNIILKRDSIEKMKLYLLVSKNHKPLQVYS